MNNISRFNNNDSFDKTRTLRWDRISRIILDGVSRDLDQNDRYFSKLVDSLAGFNAVNFASLTGI